MKKFLSMLLSILMMIVFAAGCGAQPEAVGETNHKSIILRIGNPFMRVNGEQIEIDAGRGTVPIIENDRTLLPIRAVVEAMGGAVAWEEETQTVVLAKDSTILLLTIGSSVVFLNEEAHTLDTAPVVHNDRTMLPIHFIAENFGYNVSWNGDTQSILLMPK